MRLLEPGMETHLHKLNNSYESEQSSSNGSINEAITSEPSATTPLNLHLPDLFAVDRINNSFKMNDLQTASINNSDDLIISESDTVVDFDSELTQYSSTLSSAEISDQNEKVIKELDRAKLTKMLKTFTSNESKCSLQQKTCDNNIDRSPSVMFNMENSSNATDNKINRSTAKKYNRDLSFKLNIENNNQRNRIPSTSSIDMKLLEAKKIPMQRREQSPDLFEDYLDSDDETNNENVLENSTVNYPESADTSITTKPNYWEKTLHKRLQTSLSGVLPPPSKTIIQYSISELSSLYSENLSKMPACESSVTNHSESLLKPTHTVEQIKDVGWEDLTMDVKCHGLLYNRTTYSEDIELLGMKLAERCVGVETSSSFTHDYRPSINKARMKLLSQSPGTRLSHLVGRKRGLSSANLMSDSSKLGSKQLVIDVQKNFNRKRKATTPKRRHSAKKRTPGRKTPGSQRKRLAFSAKSMISTRETSKRALFQSPPQQKPKPILPLDLARRVDKSRRMLFSPSKDEHDKKLHFNQPNLKRRRDEDGLLGNQSKIPRMSGFEEIRTPRSLLAKSQTFCVTETTSNDSIKRTSSVLRARSDVTLHGSQQLSQSHRRKLLWAVSTSLKKKNIHTQHPNFTAFAGVLAKVVKRLFLESRDESASTSDTMIRIADRLVFWVVQGKTVDEICLNEKMRKENLRAATRTKLKGYIAPEDYEKLKKPLPKFPSNLFLSQSSTDSFSLSQPFNFNMQSQHSDLSQNTERLLNDISLSNNCFNESRSLSALPETVNYALCSSSSKSNTSGSVLRENVRESEVKQKSGQKQVEFSGKDQKNVSPYHDSKLMLSGGSRTNIMNVKRQISFDA